MWYTIPEWEIKGYAGIFFRYYFKCFLMLLVIKKKIREGETTMKTLTKVTIAIAAALILCSSPVSAEEKPSYVPNQIIVKVVKVKDASTEAFSSLLPNVNIKRIDKVFKGKPPKKELIQAKLNKLAKIKAKKTNKDILEERRLNRLLHAEENHKKLGLDRVYIIDVETQDIFSLIEKLKQNPRIEYAQPNYIY